MRRTLSQVLVRLSMPKLSPRCLSTTVTSGFKENFHARKTFEPDYLDSAGFVAPTLPTFNVQMKGYDFDVLESYQSFAHKLAENSGLDVVESWATPCTSWMAKNFAEGSTKVKDTYTLHIYERNIQISDARTTDLPPLLDILRRTLPEGVSLSIHEHTEEHYEARFIPDPFIDGLKKELTQLESKKQDEIDKKAIEKGTKTK